MKAGIEKGMRGKKQCDTTQILEHWNHVRDVVCFLLSRYVLISNP